MSRHHVVLVLSQRNPTAPAYSLALDDLSIPAYARHEPHLTQWVTATPSPDAAIEAHYVFDDVYVRAHPEAMDPRHLGLLHALLTAKLLDDGDVLATPQMLEGSCRWPSVGQRRKSLATE